MNLARRTVSQPLITGLSLILVGLVCGDLAVATAQNNTLAIRQCQDEIKARIQRERGSQRVDFRSTQDYLTSNTQITVRGIGVAKDGEFSYGCTISASYDFNRRSPYGGGTQVPSWLVGSFRGKDPVSRQKATVTIDWTGYASAVFDDGRRENGSYIGNAIRFDQGSAWEIVPSGNDFKAFDAASRRTEKFKRTSSAGNDVVGGIPQWVVGTFRGLTSNGEAELRINQDGSATARSLSTNRSFSGSYSNGVLRFDFGSFNLSREGNDVRTIEINNPGNTTLYRRIY